QPLRSALGKPSLPDLGPPPVLVRPVGTGKQRAQREVAGARLHEQQQPVRLVAVPLVFEPDVAAYDPFDTQLARRLVELHHAEHVGQGGERQRRHAVRRRRLDRLLEADDAIYDRVFTVQSQMDERWRWHWESISRPIACATEASWDAVLGGRDDA